MRGAGGQGRGGDGGEVHRDGGRAERRARLTAADNGPNPVPPRPLWSRLEEAAPGTPGTPAAADVAAFSSLAPRGTRDATDPHRFAAPTAVSPVPRWSICEDEDEGEDVGRRRRRSALARGAANVAPPPRRFTSLDAGEAAISRHSLSLPFSPVDGRATGSVSTALGLERLPRSPDVSDAMCRTRPDETRGRTRPPSICAAPPHISLAVREASGGTRSSRPCVHLPPVGPSSTRHVSPVRGGRRGGVSSPPSAHRSSLLTVPGPGTISRIVRVSPRPPTRRRLKEVQLEYRTSGRWRESRPMADRWPTAGSRRPGKMKMRTTRLELVTSGL